MKKLFLSLAFAVATSSLLAVEVGDTLKQVHDQKGPPTNKLSAGNVVILKYPDETIKLRDGKVVEIKSNGPGSGKVSARSSALAAGKWAAEYSTLSVQSRT